MFSFKQIAYEIICSPTHEAHVDAYYRWVFGSGIYGKVCSQIRVKQKYQPHQTILSYGQLIAIISTSLFNHRFFFFIYNPRVDKGLMRATWT